MNLILNIRTGYWQLGVQIPNNLALNLLKTLVSGPSWFLWGLVYEG